MNFYIIDMIIEWIITNKAKKQTILLGISDNTHTNNQPNKFQRPNHKFDSNQNDWMIIHIPNSLIGDANGVMAITNPKQWTKY